MNKIEVLLKEYETLRQESTGSMSNRSQIVSFGLAAVGVLMAGMFASDATSQAKGLMVLVFSFAVPITSIIVLYMWLGEVERMVRTGRFIAELENRINDIIDKDDPVLTWESWLRRGNLKMRYPYVVVVALFLGIATFSPLIGFATNELAWRSHWWALVAPWTLAAGATTHIALRSLKLTRPISK